MKTIITAILVIIGGLAVVAVVSLLLAFPVKWTWNYVMPYLFNLKALTWSQAWCLMFLSGVLLKTSATSSSKD